MDRVSITTEREIIELKRIEDVMVRSLGEEGKEVELVK